MTKELEVKGEEAHKMRLALIECYKIGARAFMQAGHMLLQINESKTYKTLGYKSMNEFMLATCPHTPARGYQLMDIAEVFYNYNPECSSARLLPLVRIVKDKPEQEIKDWIVKAETMTHKDFNDEIRIQRGKQPVFSCDHPIEDSVDYVLCKKCGGLRKSE